MKKAKQTRSAGLDHKYTGFVLFLLFAFVVFFLSSPISLTGEGLAVRTTDTAEKSVSVPVESFDSLVLEESGSASTYFYAAGKPLVVKLEGVVEPEYLFHDRLGSDIQTNSLPFGQEIESGDRFGFTGKERDDSGLHYFAARYYDSSIGRFTSVDPVPSEPAYQYVRNNPLFFVDPSGRSPDAAHIKETVQAARQFIRDFKLARDKSVVADMFITDLDIMFATFEFLMQERERYLPRAISNIYIGLIMRVRGVDAQDRAGPYSLWSNIFVPIGAPGEWLEVMGSWQAPTQGSPVVEYDGTKGFDVTYAGEALGALFSWEFLLANGQTYPSPDTHIHFLIPALNVESQQKSLSGDGSSSASMLLYPNPVVSRELTIRLPGGVSSAKAAMYSVGGERVHAFSVKSTDQIVTLPDNLASGTYILQLFGDDNNLYIEKFTVVN